MARPSLATPERISTARRLFSEGKLADQIATEMEVSLRTVTRLLAQADHEPIHPASLIVLPRTGNAPLRFLGTLVSRASGLTYHKKPGEANPHWYELAVYEIDSTELTDEAELQDVRHVVEISYHKSVHEQTCEHFTALLTDSPARTLAGFDPISVLAGYPDSKNFEIQQRRLEDDCRRQYFALVSEVLEKFPEDLTSAQVDTRDGELLDVFHFLCHFERSLWQFTRAEAACIVDAGFHVFLHGDSFMSLVGELRASIDGNNLDEKWKVDKENVLAKVRQMKPSGLAALAVSIRTFWEHTDKPMNQALTLAGFNFS